MKRWQNPDILFGSWWEFPSLDKKGGLHANNYHGQFIPQVAEQLILRYTEPGQTVLDLFLGSGTTAIECQRLGRLCVGVDLNTSAVPVDNLLFYQGDSANSETVTILQQAMSANNWPSPTLCILHPPYHNIVKFSNDPRDLSCQPSVKEFLVQMTTVLLNATKLTEDTLALVLGDIYVAGEVIPLGFWVTEIACGLGWKLKAINIKNIANTERGPGNGKMKNLMRFRADKNGYNLFEHEYVMVLKR